MHDQLNVSFGNQTNNCLGVFSNYLIDYNLIVNLRNFGKTRKYRYWPIITKIWTVARFKNRFIFANFIQSAKIPFSNDKLNVCLVDHKVHQSNFGDIEANFIIPRIFIYFEGKECFQFINCYWLNLYCFVSFLHVAFKRSCNHWNVISSVWTNINKKMLNLFVARFYSKTSFGR